MNGLTDCVITYWYIRDFSAMPQAAARNDAAPTGRRALRQLGISVWMNGLADCVIALLVH
jgi:hypothetical protein